jgi:hypothetical protein
MDPATAGTGSSPFEAGGGLARKGAPLGPTVGWVASFLHSKGNRTRP